MVVLNPGQAAAYLKAAGFPQSSIPTMVAVGFAESGFDTEAIGPDGHDFGWLQIRDVHKGMLPDFFPPSGRWKDPLANAAAAKKIYDGQGLGAWAPSDNSRRQGFMGQASMAAAQIAGLNDRQNLLAYAGYPAFAAGGSPGGLGILSGLSPDFVANSGQGYPDSIGGDALDFLTKDPSKFLWIGGGATLVLLGVLLMAKNDLPLSAIAKVVT